MLKKIVLLVLGCFIVTNIWGEEIKDLSYYNKSDKKIGNIDYLNERCKLDIRTPKGGKNLPVLVWFHGGGITKGNKRFLDYIDKNKIIQVAVNYRLSGDKAACPDYIYDAAAAVAWVLKNISKYGGDPSKVYVSGHSAGGYLATMIALDPQYLANFNCKPKDVKRYLPVSGQMTTHFQLLNERRKKDSNTPDIALDNYAPIALASKDTPPLTLIVGDSDIEWPARVEENQLLEARLRRNFKNKDVKFYSFKSFNHGTVLIPGLVVINNAILADL